MCRLSWNLGALTSWNPQGLSRPVMGLLYLLYQYMWNVTQAHWLLYSQRNCPTHSQYIGSILQLWSTTRGTLESISHCVVYKTATNILCFAAGRTQQLTSPWGGRKHQRRHFLSRYISWNYLWKHDLRWNLLWIHGNMHSKKFIILIHLCVKFSYYILMQKNVLP